MMDLISVWFLLGACLCITTANPVSSFHPSDSMMNMPPQSVSGSGGSFDNIDMCLKNPCLAGLVCKSVPPEHVSVGFICLNSSDADARQVHTNMELVYQEAIMDNVEKIATNSNNHVGHLSITNFIQQHQQQQQQQPFSPSALNPNERSVMLSLKNIKPTRFTCEQKPCQQGEQCLAKPETLQGYVCVREQISVVQKENSIIEKLESDDKFQIDTLTKCSAALRTNHQRLDIQGHPTLYIECKVENDEQKSISHVIMTCPESYVFNKFHERCDSDQEPMSTGCASSPCQFGAACHELSNLDYRCDCPPGFTGKNCQQAPDVCSVAPCGHSDGNICHVLPPESGLAYYCTCFSGKAYGLSCEEDKIERNPCEESLQVGSIFSTRISPTVFGVCDEEHQLNLRVCDKKMRALGQCDWLAKAKVDPSSNASTHRKRRGAAHKRKTPIRKHHK